MQYEMVQIKKLKGRVKKGKQEPKDHHQTRHSLHSHALATDNLELMANSAFNEHTITYEHLILRI